MVSTLIGFSGSPPRVTDDVTVADEAAALEYIREQEAKEAIEPELALAFH